MPLIEKAYAKFLGCYQDIHQRDISGIMSDLTGGTVRTLHVNILPEHEVWERITDALDEGHLIVQQTARTDESPESAMLLERQ